ncbi:MAG: TolC family protein [Pseudomonadales bacterium]|nr:TolC family protein [Pseudomonadales bacterium]
MSLFFPRLGYCVAVPLLLLTSAMIHAATTLPVLATTETLATQSVTGYIESVLHNHPQLKVADADVAAAQARADGLNRPLYNPELNVDVQRAQSNSYAAGLSMTLDVSGKGDARRLNGQKQLAQAIAERAALRQQLASAIGSALVDYSAKQTALALLQQRLELLQRFAAIADRQYQAGDTGVLDRNLGSLALAEAMALTGKAELELLQARRNLDAVTRNPLLEPPTLPSSLPLPSLLPDNMADLAHALPQIQAANSRAEVALSEVAIARSNGRADPTVGIRGGRESSQGESGATLVGVQVSIPLFVRNNFSAEQATAAATADAAHLEANALYEDSLARMQATARQYRSAYAAWQRWQSASSARLDEGVELLDKVWKVHEISTADYLVQLKQLLDGRAAGAELNYQTWRAWFDWLDSSGQWQNGLASAISSAQSTPAASANSGH